MGHPTSIIGGAQTPEQGKIANADSVTRYVQGMYELLAKDFPQSISEHKQVVPMTTLKPPCPSGTHRSQSF